MTKKSKLSRDKRLCECGCKGLVTGYNYKRQQPHRYIHGHNSKGKPAHPNSIHRGSDNWAWKGGRRINSQGYVLICKPDHPRADNNNCVREHILVMEHFLGRYITRDEEVHHINGNKQDNRIENLKLLSNHAEHMAIHKKDMSNRRCADCGKAETGKRLWNKTKEGGFLCVNCFAYRKYYGLSI